MLTKLGRVTSETKICQIGSTVFDGGGGWLMYYKPTGTGSYFLCVSPLPGYPGWMPVTDRQFCPENSIWTHNCYF